ncbi:MAG: iron-containing alcohol dehydrogenase [Candidatus Eremiobacteraeota bacterium]|nr:iron-containing alcohol dehydrogenase [Candidatus Eremiobacteraeota bacterium]
MMSFLMLRRRKANNTVEEHFNFHLATNLTHGIGCSRKIGDFLPEKAFRTIHLMVDEGVEAHSRYHEEIRNLLEKKSRKIFCQVLRGSEEPDYDYLDEVAGRARNLGDLDLLIGVGGGSCLDTAKAVAVLVTNGGKGIEYRGFDKVMNPGVPTLLIPSTAGTGSEATINAVFIDKHEKKKLGINGRYMSATYAMLDAEWTLSCPKAVAVSSGMDALTHTLESFMCKKANPLTRFYSREAFRLLYHALPCLVEDPGNKEKRQDLLRGSYLAGIALYNSGSGISGALSYPIGVHYKVPHGMAGAVFLATVVEYNVERGYRDYAELYDLIEPGSALPCEEKNRRFSHLLSELSGKIEVPQYLDRWGITKDNIEEVAQLMLPLQAAFDQNPVPFSADADAKAMLKKHVQH